MNVRSEEGDSISEVDLETSDDDEDRVDAAGRQIEVYPPEGRQMFPWEKTEVDYLVQQVEEESADFRLIYEKNRNCKNPRINLRRDIESYRSKAKQYKAQLMKLYVSVTKYSGIYAEQIIIYREVDYSSVWKEKVRLSKREVKSVARYRHLKRLHPRRRSPRLSNISVSYNTMLLIGYDPLFHSPWCSRHLPSELLPIDEDRNNHSSQSKVDADGEISDKDEDRVRAAACHVKVLPSPERFPWEATEVDYLVQQVEAQDADFWRIYMSNRAHDNPPILLHRSVGDYRRRAQIYKMFLMRYVSVKVCSVVHANEIITAKKR